jgi:hypothetical protein
MIISFETFYNISAVLHIALLVWITVLIFSSVIVAVAKVRALRDLKSVKTKMEAMIDEVNDEDPHKHFETHAHEVGEALSKGDLVVAREGVLMKANRSDYEEKPRHFSGFSRPAGVHVETVDLSKAPAEVQKMAKELEEEMQAKGQRGHVRAIRVASFAGGKFEGVAVDKPKRKRPAAKKVAKKIIKKKNK